MWAASSSMGSTNVNGHGEEGVTVRGATAAGLSGDLGPRTQPRSSGGDGGREETVRGLSAATRRSTGRQGVLNFFEPGSTLLARSPREFSDRWGMGD